MRLLAIDPGPQESAAVIYDLRVNAPVWWTKEPNHEILRLLDERTDRMAIEMVKSYGMAVGAEVFETCVWAGRLIERWLRYHNYQPIRLYRHDVKTHICHSQLAKDKNIRQALIDRYGGKEKAIGKKASPGVCYGMAGDCWQALAVAVTACETRLDGRQAA